MKRKIIEQGYNTLTVSLPKKWCDNHKLKNGDEIDVSEKENCLLISKEAFLGEDKVSVDVTGLDRSTIILLIQSLYEYGYDSIEIKTNDSKAKWHWADKEISLPSIITFSINRLIGAELINSSKGVYNIQIIAGEMKESFNIVLRRVFLLLIDLFETFIERYRKNDVLLIDQMNLKYPQFRRFANYLLRLLNKFGHEDARKTTFYFGIIKSLNRIAETMKNLTGPEESPLKISKKTCDLIQEIKEAFDDYYALFYKYDAGKISDLVKTRDLFKRKVYYEEFKKLSKEDIYLLAGVEQVIDSIMDLVELRIAIEN